MSVVFWSLTGLSLLLGTWFLVPTARSVLNRRFWPTWRSRTSVFYAEQSSHP